MTILKWASVLAIIVSFLNVSCRPRKTDANLTDESLLSVTDSVITGIGGAIDDQAGSTFSLRHQKNKSLFTFRLFPEAAAAACGSRAFSAACSSGVRTTSYSSCTLSSSGFSVDGSVTLTYSDAACAMATTGFTATRTASMTYTGPLGIGAVASTSASHLNYAGNTVGGGLTLTKTANANEFTVDVPGMRRVRTRDGATVYDVSIRTTSSVLLTNGLSQGARTLNGGQIEVALNHSQYTIAMEPSNLVWGSASCCFPTSGSVNITVPTVLGGAATLTFSGCGTATFTKAGKASTITLGYCE